MTGMLTLWRDPVGPFDAATKQYIDRNSITPIALNAKDFGAKGDGVTDDTAAINAALAADASGIWHNVYLPPGVYRITNTITVNAGRRPSDQRLTGQTLFGDNKTNTQILVDYSFNPSATSVIALVGNAYGSPGVEKLGIFFAQPNVSSRSNFDTLANGAGTNGKGVMYPPAIDLTNGNNCLVDSVWIGGAWIGIHAAWTMSNGVNRINNIDCGAFYRGLDFAGSVGIIDIGDYHFFPWGIPGGGTNAVYMDGGTYAAVFTDNQGATCTNFFSQNARLAILQGSNPIWGPNSFSNLQMDGNNATIEVNCPSALVQIVGGYSTGSATGSNTNAQLQIAAGTVKVSSHEFENNGQTGPASVSLTGGDLELIGSRIVVYGTGYQALVQSGGVLTFTGNQIVPGSASAWTVPMVSITGGNYNITGNVFCAPGGSGVAINSSADATTNAILDNSFGAAWTFTPPGLQGSYIGTSWYSWTPTLAAQSGTLGASAATAWGQRIGKQVTIELHATITSAGTGSGGLMFNPPVAANNSIEGTGTGRNDTTGTQLLSMISGGTVYVQRYDGATIIANSTTVSASISYVAA
jgi:hypothetical protein